MSTVSELHAASRSRAVAGYALCGAMFSPELDLTPQQHRQRTSTPLATQIVRSPSSAPMLMILKHSLDDLTSLEALGRGMTGSNR